MSSTGEVGRFAWNVRFGCGATLGLVLGAFAAFGWTIASAWGVALFATAAAVLLGLASAFLGDRFWAEIRKWTWWT